MCYWYGNINTLTQIPFLSSHIERLSGKVHIRKCKIKVRKFGKNVTYTGQTQQVTPMGIHSEKSTESFGYTLSFTLTNQLVHSRCLRLCLFFLFQRNQERIKKYEIITDNVNFKQANTDSALSSGGPDVIT